MHSAVINNENKMKRIFRTYKPLKQCWTSNFIILHPFVIWSGVILTFKNGRGQEQ